jgi:small subunit ribosomal protein S14
MPKVSMITKNKQRADKVAKYAIKRSQLKSAIKNKDITLEERFDLQLKLNSLSWNSSKVRVRNRCEITGRPRGYYRKFALCRNKLREFASAGLLPGLIKSSW